MKASVKSSCPKPINRPVVMQDCVNLDILEWICPLLGDIHLIMTRLQTKKLPSDSCQWNRGINRRSRSGFKEDMSLYPMRVRGFMPRKSIERYMKVAIILKAGIDNDFVYTLKLQGSGSFLFWGKLLGISSFL